MELEEQSEEMVAVARRVLGLAVEVAAEGVALMVVVMALGVPRSPHNLFPASTRNTQHRCRHHRSCHL